MSRRPRLIQYAGLALVILGTAGAARAQGVVSKVTPQAVYGAAQTYAAPQAVTPSPLYQGLPFTPQPIPAPRPILTPAAASPQASAQGPAACACYYPQGFCPMPQGFCPMPQGNCAAPVPCGPAPSGQSQPSAQYGSPQG